MLHVKLTLRNSQYRGKKLIVDCSPFLVGRDDACHLHLAGRSVSRKHCALFIRDDNVIVRDLSRNGILVNGTQVRRQDVQLWHRDVLQIGKWLLRVSVRDENRVPVTSGSRKSKAILKELDEISAMLKGGGSAWNRVAEESALPESPEDEMRTIEIVPAELSSKTKLDEAAADQASRDAEQEDGPQRLPEHLRPKEPSDSQDAAQQALRRIFEAR